MKYSIAILSALFLTISTFAQYQIGLVPRLSPDKMIYQKVGFTEVKIAYGSPTVNDRELWGGLVPYDEVWRAGANNATTVEFSSDVAIGQTKLDSGKYSLFVIPRETEKWTVIFNNTHKQWGAFRYNVERDAIRTTVEPTFSGRFDESLTYTIDQSGFNYGKIILSWGQMELEVPFETDYLKEFIALVESRAEAQPDYLKWIVYLQGAEHLGENDLDKTLALTWVDAAEKIMNSTSEWNEQFYPRDYVRGHLLWMKAKVLASHKKFEKAAQYAEEVKTLPGRGFYESQNDTEHIDDKTIAWMEESEK